MCYESKGVVSLFTVTKRNCQTYVLFSENKREYTYVRIGRKKSNHMQFKENSKTETTVIILQKQNSCSVLSFSSKQLIAKIRIGKCS